MADKPILRAVAETDPGDSSAEPKTVTPADAKDLEGLWLDPSLGDGLVDTHLQSIAVGKPKDFFRVNPIRPTGAGPRYTFTRLKA